MKTYIIDGGDVFSGTLEQFKNCISANADEESIKNWCRSYGLTLTVLDLDEPDIMIDGINLPQTATMTIKTALSLLDVYLKDRKEIDAEAMNMNRCHRKNIALINRCLA